MQKHWYHLVARTHAGLSPFWERERALPLWLRLRAEFAQDCLAAVVMPNHIHLLIQSARPAHLKRQLACQLRAYTRELFPGRSLWQKIPPPELVRDRQKLESTIRYIHLNPCRKRYTQDPWHWEFSTLHDHSGWVPMHAGMPGPWVRPEQIECWLGRHIQLWAERHRQYIIQDPYVTGAGEGARAPLHALGRQVFEQVVARATLRTPERLRQKSPARDLLVQIHAQYFEPAVPARDLGAHYGVTRQRVGALRRATLPASVLAYLERLGDIEQVLATQRQANSHSGPLEWQSAPLAARAPSSAPSKTHLSPAHAEEWRFAPR